MEARRGRGHPHRGVWRVEWLVVEQRLRQPVVRTHCASRASCRQAGSSASCGRSSTRSSESHLRRILSEPPSDQRRFALILFFAQLVLNFLWSPIFFAGHDIGLAKYVIFFMAILAAAAAGKFYRMRKAAGLLMIPYLAWLIFAATLNSTIEGLNPGAGVSLLG